MKFKITETREFIIEAENQKEAEEKYMEMIHGQDSLSIEEIDITNIDYVRKILNI